MWVTSRGNIMKSFVITILAAIVLFGSSAKADLFLNTSPNYDGDSWGGLTVFQEQFMGYRFHLSSAVEIITIRLQAGIANADILSDPSDAGNGLLFLAINPLTTPTSFPNAPDLSDAIYAATFRPVIVAGRGQDATPRTFHDDTILQYSPGQLTLPIGDYSILVGSYLFGATGLGFMVTDTTVVYDGPYDPNYISQVSGLWRNNNPDLQRTRFVIEGNVLQGQGAVAPEPGTLALLALPLLAVIRRAPRRGWGFEGRW